MTENKMDGITSLLPEGLTEDSVTEIANLVDSVINEQVEDRVRDLESKVHSFLRMKIDEMKDYAIKELEQDNEVYRNAKIFESLKTVMALELNDNDDANAVTMASQGLEEAVEENDVLISELTKVLEENSHLENSVRLLSDKVLLTEQQNEHLVGEITHLEEANELPFQSNEKAVIISETVDSEIEPENIEANVGNEFLTEDVMAFMPFSNN